MRYYFVLSFILTVIFVGCKKEEALVTIINGVLPGNEVKAIYIDINGMKWIGTNKGLACYNGILWRSYKVEDGLAGLLVNSLSNQVSYNGFELWSGTNEGASVFNYNMDGITSAISYRKENSGISGDTVFSVAESVDNVRWFGTHLGLSVFYKSNWQSLLYAIDIFHKQVVCMATSKDGWNYMGTKGSGIARYRFDEVDGITGASLYETDWSDLPSNNILSVFIEPKGNQWYGTDKGAVYHEGTEAREGWTIFDHKAGLLDNYVFSVFKDSRGIIWFGTSSGVFSYDGTSWENFTSKNGLAGNRVNAISEDIDGSLWFGTNNGLSRWDHTKWTIYRE